MIAKKKDKLLGLKQPTFPFFFFSFGAQHEFYSLKIIRKLIVYRSKSVWQILIKRIFFIIR